ncbi:hypothetical protein [Bradyrhizobium sp. B120]|uniref:hypothetical protein n=1 Tax=Bradyrhizobium sp. B120 TaxID=3410088 RepID=UPI003B98476C
MSVKRGYGLIAGLMLDFPRTVAPLLRPHCPLHAHNELHATLLGRTTTNPPIGQQSVQRQLNIQPALTILPGFPVRFIVTRDFVLARYGKGGRHDQAQAWAP